MEKFSAYRDAGTGIQPFLNPVPPNAPTMFAMLIRPIELLIGAVRTTLILAVGVFYFFTAEVILNCLHPFGFIHRTLLWLCTAVAARTVLLLAGLWWVPVMHVTKKRGRVGSKKRPWSPQAGDIIVSNWVSWIELLWLAFRFCPVFVIPVVAQSSILPAQAPIKTTPRRAGTGSAIISSPAARPPAKRVPILGYQVVSLLRIIQLTGSVPPANEPGLEIRTLESIRKKSMRPIAVFPECTTSNGRALLRFTEAFGRSIIPIQGYNVFVMCVRYDPPTTYKPTLTRSIPSTSFNPIPHIFEVASSLSPSLSQSLSIRLLDPTESPSCKSFLASDVLGGVGHLDELSEACSVLISQLGKMRITAQAWEDKKSFLEFYRGKAKK
ncbi:hypothetical protein BU17DRAFT_37834 [Hysterangium stoloniferum]|nr:hypothetical protein BU17DRAFT_37834 [Hysterangium stoloniferum]